MVPQMQEPVRGVKSGDVIVATDQKDQGAELLLGERRFNLYLEETSVGRKVVRSGGMR
jgi:hypothetical protein